MSYWGRALLACLCFSSLAAPAKAAELRLSFIELARITTAVMADAKLHLHNVPGGFLSLGGDSSSFTITGQKFAVDMKPQPFEVLGSTYAYYVNDMTSTSVKVTPVTGAIRLEMTFESDGPEMVGGCIKGSCGLANSLPNVEWSKPSVGIELIPVHYQGSLALKVRKAEIGGTLTPVCRSSTGVISNAFCNLGLPWARHTIARMRNEIDGIMKANMNQPAAQEALATALKPYLKVGPAGEISIAQVTADARGLVVSFQLASAAP